MPKPVCPNMATATPLGLPGPRRRRSSTPGCSSWTRNHPPPESVFPRARHGRSLPRCGELAFRTQLRGIGLEPGTWKDPDPRRRSSRGSGGLRIGLPARQWRLRDACGLSRLNDLLALWSQAHMPSCNRQGTSTSVHTARPGSASAPRAHAPL
jgi:hypothetical protein